MSEEKSKASPSKRKKHSKKHYTIVPYIVYPLLFALISLIFVAPVAKAALNFAVTQVHSFGDVLKFDYNDYQIHASDFTANEQTSGSAKLPKLYSGFKIGELQCENTGLDCDVYYCINRVTLRNGAALSQEANAFGQGGAVDIAGYSSTVFRSLDNIKNGDIITAKTEWGTFTYEVYDVQVLKSDDISDFSEETLILSTSESKDGFSNYSKQKKYVFAKKISGPTVEEVIE